MIVQLNNIRREIEELECCVTKIELIENISSSYNLKPKTKIDVINFLLISVKNTVFKHNIQNLNENHECQVLEMK